MHEFPIEILCPASSKGCSNARSRKIHRSPVAEASGSSFIYKFAQDCSTHVGQQGCKDCASHCFSIAAYCIFIIFEWRHFASPRDALCRRTCFSQLRGTCKGFLHEHLVT